MSRALSRAHRADLSALTRLAGSDLSLIMAKFNPANAPAVRDGLLNILPDLVDIYGSAAAALGADWYEEMRAEAGVRGRFTAFVAMPPDPTRIDALARWGVGPLFSAEPDLEAVLSMIDGGLQRIIADEDRQSVMESSIADPRAHGWQRVGEAECAFCQMLIDRGDVYSEATADFESHDHCLCYAEPAWSP